MLEEAFLELFLGRFSKKITYFQCSWIIQTSKCSQDIGNIVHTGKADNGRTRRFRGNMIRSRNDGRGFQ